MISIFTEIITFFQMKRTTLYVYRKKTFLFNFEAEKMSHDYFRNINFKLK